MNILQSSGGELAEVRLWLLPAAVSRWHYDKVPGDTITINLHKTSKFKF